MLRPTIKNDIYLILSSSKYFNVSDFKIQIVDKNFSVSVLIKYEYDEQYYIQILVPNSITTKERTENVSFANLGSITRGNEIQTRTVKYDVYEINTTMCPGIMSYKETLIYEGEKGITKAITKWLDNLWEDLTISPQLRAIKNQTDEIERIKEKVINVPDEYFTVEEGEEIKSRLDKLEQQLATVFQNEVSDHNNANPEIEKLHAEIDILKQTIYTLKKQGWFKSFITKTMTWLSNPSNQKLLKAGKDLVVTMLPEGKNEK